MSKIGVGDIVICIQAQGNPPKELPQLAKRNIPVFGRKYVVTGVYRMKYGLGCTLEGLDPNPYRGYLLFVHDPFAKNVARGWYYAKVEPVAAWGAFETVKPRELEKSSV
jgi:hypothetical protein